ncbi:MAG: hypothetical protein ACTHJT_02035 [Cytophaga sp.]|uniref:hypothetical protein n=1 Tax=Cytophaga sp. TaxID=29535 RepID=UPI003F814731
METKQKQLIYTGLFKSRESIENAYNALFQKGYGKNSISIIMLTETREKYFTDVNAGEKKIKGLWAAVNTATRITDILKEGVVIPGRNIVVTGPLSAGLSGAGRGGFSTGVISSLIGIPDVEAKEFEEGIDNGYMIMSVQPCTSEDSSYLEKVWQENNVGEVYKK